MKRLAAAALITVLSAAVCSAEPVPSGPPNPPPGASGMAETGRPDGPRRGPSEGEREGGWHHRPAMPGMKGAHLRFRRGETGIDFKCAAEDTTKACVDALMPLVDKLLQVR